ncbi:cytochrome d ubiquinol oxidase subunit II [Sphingomonas sp. OTU376]|uniref:cytochrome d ubiquinol oxidase subunit II n=1 Tax=Sphingomonas sp. OTU376 TaxID=3043863 RepID=UPI00313EA0F3
MIDLPLLSALFVAFALALYVLLDGFDLGVGALLLFQPDEAVRDRMVASITPTWDGNETWLIMAGVALLAGFPIAYGILLPAFYLPLVIMLLSLGLRGVSFEFRVQQVAGRRGWDLAFGIGSITAGAMQGLIVGGLVEGVTVAPAVGGWSFAGQVTDLFRPFALLSAVALVTGQGAFGAAWLRFKGTDALQGFATRALQRILPITLLLGAATFAAAVVVQPGMAAAWARMPLPLGLSVAAFLACGLTAWISIDRAADGAPFAWVIAMIAAAIVGLGLAIFPDVVPFRLSLWEAASATSSHIFLLVGASIVTPIVLAYSAFAYHVFRGKTPVAGWDA